MKCLLFFCLCLFTVPAFAQPGTVKSYKKIDIGSGSALADSPALWHYLGNGGCVIRDVDGDGNPELMTSALFDQDSKGFQGIIHQIRLNADGSPKHGYRYFDMRDYPTSIYFRASQFYDLGFNSICNLGDLNGDGFDDIAVGNPRGNGDSRGEVYVFYMNANGKFDSVAQIRDYGYGLNTSLPDKGGFGISPARIGDLDGDGVPEIAVGQGGYDSARGQLWILFMRQDGRVKSWQTIHSGSPNFMQLPVGITFAKSIAGIGDLDKDGVPDLMVGAPGVSTAGRGAVWTLFLNADGTLKSYKYYPPGGTAFPDTVQTNTLFAISIDAIGDLDGDSVSDVAIGHRAYNDGSLAGAGRVWIWLMNTDGSIKGTQTIDKSHSSPLSAIHVGDNFGSCVFRLGDFNKDGVPDLAVGGSGDDAADTSDVGRNSGSIYLLNLNGVPITTGTGDIISNSTKDFYTYPNPASDRINVRSKNEQDVIQSWTLSNALGQTIQASKAPIRFVSVLVSDLPSGNYFINVQKNGKSQIIQFIKK